MVEIELPFADASLDSDSTKDTNSVEVNSEENFENELEEILQRIQNLLYTDEVLREASIKGNAAEVYSKICKIFNITENSTFLFKVGSEKMDFSYHCLAFYDFIAITKALSYCHSLKELNLSFNKLSSENLLPLISLLNENESITRLNLNDNEISMKGSTRLGELISVCHSITLLDLSNNHLGDEELAVIGTHLAEINAVKILNLSRNDIGIISASLFGSSIAKCSALEELNLSSNHLGEGVSSIFSNLKHSSLKFLNVSKSGIPDESMQALATVLRASKTLQQLDISHNFISNKGVSVLPAGIKKSSSLEVLKMAHNPFQGKAANVLLSAAGANLKMLDLSGIKVDLLFMKTYRKFNTAGRDLKVIFGSEFRYDSLPRDYFSPDDDSVDESNALHVIQKLADRKGISLRNTLKSIHASFLIDKAQEGSVDDKAEAEKERKMTTGDFARGLVNSNLGAPKSIAQQLATSLADEEGFVDMWDIISKLPFRPDDLAVNIKRKKEEPKEEKVKGKGKKKGK